MKKVLLLSPQGTDVSETRNVLLQSGLRPENILAKSITEIPPSDFPRIVAKNDISRVLIFGIDPGTIKTLMQKVQKTLQNQICPQFVKKAEGEKDQNLTFKGVTGSCKVINCPTEIFR